MHPPHNPLIISYVVGFSLLLWSAASFTPYALHYILPTLPSFFPSALSRIYLYLSSPLFCFLDFSLVEFFIISFLIFPFIIPPQSLLLHLTFILSLEFIAFSPALLVVFFVFLFQYFVKLFSPTVSSSHICIYLLMLLRNIVLSSIFSFTISIPSVTNATQMHSSYNTITLY